MIGERITKRREQMGWSQTDLARMLGIAPSRISEFERGIKTDCNLSTAKRLARALGVSIDYLAGTWDDEDATAPGTAAVTPTTRRRGRRPRATMAATTTQS